MPGRSPDRPGCLCRSPLLSRESCCRCSPPVLISAAIGDRDHERGQRSRQPLLSASSSHAAAELRGALFGQEPVRMRVDEHLFLRPLDFNYLDIKIYMVSSLTSRKSFGTIAS